MIITLNFCVDVEWQISHQPFLFPKLSFWHWQITPLSFWKHPFVKVETFKVKVYLAVPRHFSAQPFCPVLMLAFAWQIFSSLHLRLAPFLGSLIVLQLQYWLSKFWKSTVLDSAKPFGQIWFFCYIALSISSPRVHLKKRVVALLWGSSICSEVVLWHWIVSLHKRVFPEWQELEVERDIELQGKSTDENDLYQRSPGEETASPPAGCTSPRRGTEMP